MIELNKEYNAKKLVQALNISYSTFCNNRKEYEEHLAKFYLYTKTAKGRSNIYVFTKELGTYISLKEYRKGLTILEREKLRTKIKQTIEVDNRQTAANISRIIYAEGEFYWADSTLTNYTRDELREMVQSGYYAKADYAWCYLDKENNKYILMNEEQIKELRKWLKSADTEELIENTWARYHDGEITFLEAQTLAGSHCINAIMSGREAYKKAHGVWPIKAPVYIKSAFVK